MRKICYGWVVALLLLMVSCNNHPEALSPVVGTWEAQDSKMLITMGLSGATVTLNDSEDTYDPNELVLTLTADKYLLADRDTLGTYMYDDADRKLTLHTDRLLQEVNPELVKIVEQVGIDVSKIECLLTSLSAEKAKVLYQSSTPITISKEDIPFEMPRELPDQLTVILNVQITLNLTKQVLN